jgi:hypothetical protein
VSGEFPDARVAEIVCFVPWLLIADVSCDDGRVIDHRRVVSAWVLAGAVVLVSCGDHGMSVGHRAGSGVRGSVTAGPTCPVERPDRVCPPLPVTATVVARTVAGKQVAHTRSDPNDGHYRLSLSPGTYRVSAGTGALPHCPELTVTVSSGRFARADFACDTGIR